MAEQKDRRKPPVAESPRAGETAPQPSGASGGRIAAGTVANGPTLPSPTLPKGGGAIAPIGEKLVPNPQMGTASFTVPVFTSPGRGNFGPNLTLSYDAGAGNGPYGLGWSLSLPNITRKTDKGLPLYHDRAESDVFIISGSEDLVPIGSTDLDGEHIVRYRPRVDGEFARIERHVRADATSYWVAWTRDNIRSVYGYTPQAQAANPDHPRQVFRWLLEWTDDDKGNCIAYVYKAEDAVGIAPSLHEQGRAHNNVYLKAIAYGHPVARTSRDTPPIDLRNGRATALADWPLVVILDYGEHDTELPTLEEGQWPARPDPFSSYRSGFELRTHRLCRRILMTHRFAELGATRVVVRSTELGYKPNAALTYLQSVKQVGWKWNGTSYETRAMPEINLGYGEVGVLSNRVRFLDDAHNLPELDGKRYALVDYDGEGLPGVLTEQAGRGWFYKRPEGRDGNGAGHFGEIVALHPRPASALAEGFQLQDVNGDGLVDLVRVGAQPAGVFERQDDEWLPFRAFPSRPAINWDDPNLRFVDLDGDGFPDLMVVDQEVIRWHHGLARDGYAGETRALKPNDHLEPMPLFATERDAVLLADMTGDGLSDVVHVRNGSISYWPNLGYGRFGQRVQMSGAPRLDAPDGFDPKRVRFGDVDGTGTSDLVYLARDGAHLYLNQAGNSFAAQPVITTLPPVDSLTDLSLTDLWGTGTACLVWSTPLPNRRLRWIDLLEGHKPHLLESIDNGFGARTTLEHAPSTKYYLQDRAAGLPWITKLPFPVQVLDKTTVEDLVAQTKIVTVRRYHHGFYDGLEREFRGFAMVEQEDSESVALFAGKSEYPRGLDETLHIPTVSTKSWFHTGAFLDGTNLSNQLAAEYFPSPYSLEDSALPAGLLPDEKREAARALRGRPLRAEVYALDGDPNPYSITETNYLVRLERSRGAESHAVFAVFPRETLSVRVERQLSDPRVHHEVVLKVGPYGDVEEKVAIAYPRAASPSRRTEQERLWALHTRDSFVHHDVDPDDHRLGIPTEAVTSELIGLASDHVLSFFEVQTGAAAPERPWVPPEQRTLPGRWLVEHTKLRYWDDTALTELADGQATARALPSRTLSVAFFRPDLLTVWAGRAIGVDLLAQQFGGYVVEGDTFWAFPGTIHYDPNTFYLPVSMVDPFGGVTHVHYAPDALMPDWSQDAVGNRTQVTNDYRRLAPRALTDANGAKMTAETDALGVVIATKATGAGGEGGTLSRIDYTFGTFATPTQVHVQTFQDFSGTPIEEVWVYSDGAGREIQRKQRTVDGLEDPEDQASPTLSPRFMATGRTVFNNKGLPVKKYEPYFSGISDFDAEAALATRGVTPVLHYDPLARLIRMDQPNGTFSTVEFDAWSTTTSDEVDTLDVSTAWYADRIGGTFAREPQLEKAAAVAALTLSQTPTVEHLDALGRIVATVRDAGSTDPQRYHETSRALDIEGAVLAATDPRFIAANKRLTIARQTFDVSGRLLFIDSVDAGKSWMLPDAVGTPIYVWRADAGQTEALRVRHEYDLARRLIAVWEQPESATAEILRERTLFRDGAGVPDYGAGRIFAELDGAGLVTYAYDFRGAVVKSIRHVLRDGTRQADWTSFANWSGIAPIPATLDPEELVTSHAYDAVGREVLRRTFVGNRTSGAVRTRYNVAGQIVGAVAELPQRVTPTGFVIDVEYDAKGRRHQATYGHGAVATYAYDPLTFRLNALKTEKGASVYQSLVYAYDPVGNVTAIRDDAQDATYFQGNIIKPERDYTYDALYRVSSAVGREHLSQAQPDQRDIPDPLALPLADAADLAKMVRYSESYTYDPSGNLQALTHAGALNWTRKYMVEATSNRLVRTTIGVFNSNYGTDHRGNTTSMPHLASMMWNHRDELVAATRTRVGNSTDPTPSPPDVRSAPVFFAYDQRGQRIRKLAQTPTGLTERIYLGGFDLYRERTIAAATPSLERETLHIQDGERRLALVETRVIGSVGPKQLIRYQHADHLDSAAVELDEFATPLSYEEFHPYGTTSIYLGLASKRYRFTAMERDEESGLSNHQQRYYAPWLGRWTSCDPDGITRTTNLFNYADNRPTVLTDQDGREPRPSERSWVLNVDNFVSAEYSLDSGYDPKTQHAARPGGREPGVHDSTLLTLHYGDGTTIQVDFNTISDKSPTDQQFRKQTHDATIGEGGRIFPAELNPRTTPRLLAEKKKAQAALEANFLDFFLISFQAVMANLPIPVGGLHPAPEPDVAPLRIPGSRPAGRGIWDLAPSPRGFAAEQRLGGNLPAGFKTIDRATGTGPIADEIASIKSVDLRSPAYQKPNAVRNLVNGYTGKVADFRSYSKLGVTVRAGSSTSRVLDVVIEPGAATAAQSAELKAAVSTGAQRNVTVRVHAFR